MVNGFDDLSPADKQLFEKFLPEFLSRWEYPEQWQADNVFRVEGDGESYLRVNFVREVNGEKRNTWLHVINQGTWY